MKRLLAGLVAASLLSLPAHAALKAGDAAPDFSLQASQAGKAFSFHLADAVKKGPVVVYFYPSAYTGGCNLQAHTFSEKRAEFDAAGASIIGVSLDSIARLNDFSADPQYCAGRFPVASDAGGKTAMAYGLQVHKAPGSFKDTRGQEIDHDFTERTTFVVGAGGKVLKVVEGMSPMENVAAALKFVQGLPKGK